VVVLVNAENTVAESVIPVRIGDDLHEFLMAKCSGRWST
jgi:hypothetical protein